MSKAKRGLDAQFVDKTSVITADAGLLQAIETNMTGYMLTLARACPRFQAREIGGLCIINTRARSEAFNYAFRAKRQTLITELDVVTSVEYFRRRQLPASWWFRSDSETREVRSWLVNAQLRFGHVYPGMVYDLSVGKGQADRCGSKPLPSDQNEQASISIRRVSALEASSFTQTLMAAFEYPCPFTQSAALSWAGAFSDDKAPQAVVAGDPKLDVKTHELSAYLAYLNGLPAACIALYVTGDIAGIYCVGTVPEARGRGLASRLIKHVLNEARAHDCSIVTLQASQMGAPLYRHLGFREVCNYHMWVDGLVKKRIPIRRAAFNFRA